MKVTRHQVWITNNAHCYYYYYKAFFPFSYSTRKKKKTKMGKKRADQKGRWTLMITHSLCRATWFIRVSKRNLLMEPVDIWAFLSWHLIFPGNRKKKKIHLFIHLRCCSNGNGMSSGPRFICLALERKKKSAYLLLLLFYLFFILKSWKSFLIRPKVVIVWNSTSEQ